MGDDDAFLLELGICVRRVGRGDLAAADQVWRRALRRARLPPYAMTAVIHNLGVVALAQGDAARALEHMHEAEFRLLGKRRRKCTSSVPFSVGRTE